MVSSRGRSAGVPASARGSIRWPTSCCIVATVSVLTLPGLGLVNKLPVWLTILIITRDLLIVLTVAVINLAIGRREFRPSIYGKIATATYILTCVTIMYFNYLQRTSPIVTVRNLRVSGHHADLGIPLRLQYHQDHQSELSGVRGFLTVVRNRWLLAYTPIFRLKYSIVLTSPCSSFTFGSQPSSVRALVMSG